MIKSRQSLDCRGQLCPVPIIRTEQRMDQLKSGESLEITFTDPGAEPDLKAWCRATGNEWSGLRRRGAFKVAMIRKV